MQVNFNPRKIKLIIGLGNPGENYEDTYHNVGKLAVENISEALGSKFYILNSPNYMNESGQFVAKKLKEKKIKRSELLIVHDDSDINLGNYKFSFGGNSAGHKGIESIIKNLGTKDFWRLRIGIREEGGTNPPSLKLRRARAGDFVLKKISPKNMKILESVFEKIKNFLIIEIESRNEN